MQSQFLKEVEKNVIEAVQISVRTDSIETIVSASCVRLLKQNLPEKPGLTVTNLNTRHGHGIQRGKHSLREFPLRENPVSVNN